MDYFVAVSLSFFFTFISLPVIINVFNSINLLDIPDRRKVHKVSTPSLGGLSIISAMFVTLLFVFRFEDLATLKFLLGGVLIIFVLGIRDDVASLDAKQKVIVQILAAIMVVEYANIHLFTFQGFLGIFELSPLVGKIISVIVIVALTNSFNLIDGIDGLAGGIGVLVLLFLGINFFHAQYFTFSVISIVLASGLIAFLYYNWFPSKIFMGDTGSMTLGFTIAVLIIKYINVSKPILADGGVTAPIGIAIAMLCVPIYDTLRVFIKRIIHGKSPFKADRNHIHHALLGLGFNHGQAAISLLGVNFFMMVSALVLQSMGNNWLVLSQAIVLSFMGAFVDRAHAKKLKTIRKAHQFQQGFAISKSA